jgi:aminopeptidase N
MKASIFPILCLLAFLASCTSDPGSPHKDDSANPAHVQDLHSFAQPSKCVTGHLALDLSVNFETQTLEGTAVHTILNYGTDTFIVDTRDLEIIEIRIDDRDTVVEPTYTPVSEHLGRGLKIPVTRKTQQVTIRYRTSPDAAALGWLKPVQTADNTAPFLYTQGQAILTRTWIPLQDSPGIRFTYEATIRAPKGLMAAMSSTNPQNRTADGVYHFNMKQPVPGYLIALAVGNFDFAPIGARTGVYAEPSLLSKAAYEFGDMEKMLEIAEKLYGPYQWGRYDVIVLPPSFPFGGMENPKLTFATPTIIAGDRSLVALIAHEMAHSWSGNLVTNATWNDFWLNEGFTVYFEHRIMEALYGEEYTKMLMLLDFQDLESTIEDLGKDSKDTHLFLDLEGRDPDDGMTSVAYNKGAFFLKLLEAKAGRARFDEFLRGYFDTHKFQSMTTTRFLKYLDANLIKPDSIQVDVDAWVYGPGIPADCPEIVSDRFQKVDSVITIFEGGAIASSLSVENWSTHEWLHFIRHLPHTLSDARMGDLDRTFKFTTSGNSEIAAAWYELALRNKPSEGPGYAERIMPNIEAFLFKVGRRKFLMPIYRGMKETGRREAAVRIFERCKQNYHAVSQTSIADLLKT